MPSDKYFNCAGEYVIHFRSLPLTFKIKCVCYLTCSYLIYKFYSLQLHVRNIFVFLINIISMNILESSKWFFLWDFFQNWLKKVTQVSNYSRDFFYHRCALKMLNVYFMFLHVSRVFVFWVAYEQLFLFNS